MSKKNKKDNAQKSSKPIEFVVVEESSFSVDSPQLKASEMAVLATTLSNTEIVQSNLVIDSSDTNVTESDLAFDDDSVWSFPSRSRCPRCKAIETKSRRTDSTIGRQYRECLRGICRHKYSVNGTKV